MSRRSYMVSVDGQLVRTLVDSSFSDEDVEAHTAAVAEAVRRMGGPAAKMTRLGSSEGSKKSARLRRSVFGRDGFRCRDCDHQFDHRNPYRGEGIDGLTLGHVIPKAMGGRRAVGNLIAQCSPCNEDLADRIWTGPRYPNGRPDQQQPANNLNEKR